MGTKRVDLDCLGRKFSPRQDNKLAAYICLVLAKNRRKQISGNRVRNF